MPVRNISYFLKDLLFHLEMHQQFLEYVVSDSLINFKKKIHTLNFSLQELNLISERLGVTLQQICDNTVNWQSIKERFNNPMQSMPSHYTNFGGTPISSVRSFFNYINNKFNPETTQLLLDLLETPKECLNNDKIFVNFNFINKFFKFAIRKLNLNEQNMREMSYVLYQQTQRNFIFSLAKNCTCDEDILRLMVQNSTKYEKNFKYELKTNGDLLLISSKADKEIHDGLGLKELTTPEVLLFKQYTMENTTLLMGLKPMNVLKVESKIVDGQQQVDFLLRENNSTHFLNNVHLH